MRGNADPVAPYPWYRRLFYGQAGKTEVKAVQDIKSMTPEELRAYLKELGQPDFRAKQIFQ